MSGRPVSVPAIASPRHQQSDRPSIHRSDLVLVLSPSASIAPIRPRLPSDRFRTVRPPAYCQSTRPGDISTPGGQRLARALEAASARLLVRSPSASPSVLVTRPADSGRSDLGPISSSRQHLDARLPTSGPSPEAASARLRPPPRPLPIRLHRPRHLDARRPTSGPSPRGRLRPPPPASASPSRQSPGARGPCADARAKMQQSTPVLDSTIFSSFTPTSTSRPATREGSISVDPLHRPPLPHPPPLSPPPPVPPFHHQPPHSPQPPGTQPSASRASGAGAAVRDARKPSLSSRKASSTSLPSPSARRRGSSAASLGSTSPYGVVTDATAPPALPEYALPAAAKIQTRADSVTDLRGLRSPVSPDAYAHTPVLTPTLSRTTTANAMLLNGVSGLGHHGESSAVHQHVADVAHKRISTLDYLRKAFVLPLPIPPPFADDRPRHEGRVYWLNTYLFERPDLGRMSCFDPRKLARKATNHLLLGLSIPTINDLYSSSPLEFLRCLNALLAEFDSFQQLHGDHSSSAAASLSRARLPNMFRRPGGGSRSRRSTSAADVTADEGQQLPPAGASGGAPSVMNFAAAESELFPGEEYTYLLTPSLPFEPDFFETFATLCDVLIDCYTRFLSLVPTPRECTTPVAELFAKADGKLRKIIVNGVVKEFEEHSRSHVKTEVASIGKVVLGGLM
ncbi:hypothetical protein DCS_05908 [Drechmeria coniospora]|uniref:Uncharacterized protein n=1 Tax=Drechmeria coniospora TaxID=98403 RepID=A0A151GA50_DRECN|nr:hypothetical protein DCS_05908 [Drechmeria coniospora]KYK53959.1 hypothetical protein DCS_05908 [Drechmeria coniospora]